jgi:hypothetical protein
MRSYSVANMNRTCPPGEGREREWPYFCNSCPLGYWADATTEICELCPSGTYSNTTGIYHDIVPYLSTHCTS